MECCSCVKKVFFVVDGGELMDVTVIEKYDCGGMDECRLSAELGFSLKDGYYVGILESDVWSSFNGESTEYDGCSVITRAKKSPIRGLIWEFKRNAELKRLGIQ